MRKRTDRDPFPYSPRNIRLDAGLTPQQVAKSMGVPVTAVRRLESGRTNPTAKTLAFFYAACGRVDLAARLVFFLDEPQQDRVAEIVSAWESAHNTVTYPDQDPHDVGPAA